MEFNGHRWIPLTKTTDEGFQCFSSAPGKTVKQTIETAGDLRRRRAHYEVTVMILIQGTDTTMEHIEKMTYLDMVVLETLRLHPLAGM